MPGRQAGPTVVLVRGDRELARWPLDDDARQGLGVVDRLARLQLVAGRLGCSIRLRGARGELVELLDLAGLADRLVVEVGRETEGGEEPGVEEVVMPDDPAP